MGDIIKKPQQIRSLETKNRILEAGRKLLKKDGYYNVTTADIAKEAGVSTGILYRYFTNKLDIVVEIMRQITEDRVNPLLDNLSVSVFSPDNFEAFLYTAIEELCTLHEELGSLHNDLTTLLVKEMEIAEYVLLFEADIVKKIEQLLVDNHIVIENMSEKIHIAYNLLEDYSHEKVFHHHSYIDYEVLKQEMMKTLIFVVFG